MPEEKQADIMREFAKSWEVGDVEKMVANFTDDVVVINPYGTFNGKEAFKRVLTAMLNNMKNVKVVETGNGIIVQGDKAFFEHVISGIYQGKKFEMLAMCAYEFTGDKVKNMRTVYDRLLVAQQVAPGWFARSMVNMIVKQSNKAVQ
jgi:ketosteroid isomerase-like protein